MESPDVVPSDFDNLTDTLNGTNATERFQASNEGMAVAYGSLLLMALFPIIVGSFKSVKHVAHQKLHGKADDVEVMTNKDAMMFPVYGSGVLLGIYLVFRLVTMGQYHTKRSFFAGFDNSQIVMFSNAEFDQHGCAINNG